MRICLDARFAGYAGIGRFVRGLWGGLLECGADVIALYPAGSSGYLGSHRFDAPGPIVATRSRPFLPLEQAVVPALLRRTRAAIYHSPHLTLPYAARLPLVLTVHDLFPLTHPAAATRSRTAALYYRSFFPRAIRRAGAVVAVSDPVAAEIDRLIGPLHRPVRVIEHGIGDEWRPRPEAEVRAVLDELRLERPYLLYVGTTKRRKNLQTLFAALRPGFPTLVMAGPTNAELPHPNHTASPVRALGRLREQLPALYSGAEAVVMPSLMESVGFPVLEAMACGAPVVISDDPGLRNTAGDAALVVPALDARAWSDAIGRVIADEKLRRELISAGQARVAGRTWQRAAEDYLDLYSSLVG